MPVAANNARLLAGLAGRDILASRSPWLYERESEAQGLTLTYTLYDFAALGWTDDQLPKLLETVADAGFAGLNVTHPFKQRILPLLDELAPSARRVGSVNTVTFADGRSTGHNTDGAGFAEALRTQMAGVALGHVVQVGAGGAGAATARALMDAGVGQLTLFDSDAARLASLVETLQTDCGAYRVAAGSDLAVALAAVDGIVNATPLGMASHPGSAVPLALIAARHWVADIVYFPLETELLREARRRGCRTMDGSAMVVFQAAANFDLYTGLHADRARMLRSFAEWPGTGARSAA